MYELENVTENQKIYINTYRILNKTFFTWTTIQNYNGAYKLNRREKKNKKLQYTEIFFEKKKEKERNRNQQT